MDIINNKFENPNSEEHNDNDVTPSTTYKKNIFGRQKTRM